MKSAINDERDRRIATLEAHQRELERELRQLKLDSVRLRETLHGHVELLKKQSQRVEPAGQKPVSAAAPPLEPANGAEHQETPAQAPAQDRAGYTVDGLFVPGIVGDGELMRIVGIRPTTYCERKKRGDYAPLLQDNPNGSPAPHTQYSGFKIARWLRGEPVSAGPTRQFFVSARQRRLAQGRKK